MTRMLRHAAKAKSLELAEIIGVAIARSAIPATARLPPERELAEEHRTSRVTVREGLAKLVDWGLLRVRRGSGTVVRDRRSWSFAALPLAVRGTSDPLALARMIRDLLSLRRALVEHGATAACGRVRPGDLESAREAVTRADSQRPDVWEFVTADVEIMRCVLSAAGLWPQLWLINDLVQSYVELIADTWPAPIVPDDYVAAHFACFDAIEAGDAERARAILADYLIRLDSGLCASLGMPFEE